MLQNNLKVKELIPFTALKYNIYINILNIYKIQYTTLYVAEYMT